MVTTTFMFPGQGSQYAGMGCKLMELPVIAATVEECAVEADLPIREYVLATPDAELRATERAQPAIFALSVGVARTLLNAGIRPALFAGHSIGHLTALAVSGVLRLGDAARLVAQRGQLMAAGGRRRPGAMGVIRGLDSRVVTATLDRAGLPLWPAIINLPDQVVVSGDPGAIEEARTLCTDLGGQWRRLNVSGGFHSPLLDAEAEHFAAWVEQLEIGTPSAPILRNRDGAALTQAACIREDLKRHMTGPIRWVAVMDALLEARVELAIEIGSSKVLTGLLRRHIRGLPVVTTDTPRALQRAIRMAAAQPEECPR